MLTRSVDPQPIEAVRARALRSAILLTATTLTLAALAMWASLPA